MAQRNPIRRSMFPLTLVLAAGLVLAPGLVVAAPNRAGASELPQTVRFASKDGSTELVGYLFSPAGARGAVRPAIVLMHGRAGPYSSLARGVYDATTLSMRHAFWGHYWADRGYLALLVDSFSPRGYPQGFPAHSYDERPDAVNEVTVRPLDAYGALAYLKSRPDVDHGRIALQGWSNGGSATLASLADATLAALGLKPEDGFRGALAFYPACGLHDRFKDGYKPYAPLLVFGGDNDEEVSAARCARLVEASRAEGGDIAITVYPGATHDFDDPGRKRQGVPANAAAAEDAILRATAFLGRVFK
jgi:dienelactone hydrolase